MRSSAKKKNKENKQKERASKLQLAAVPHKMIFLPVGVGLEPVLPDVMPSVQMQGLGLAGGIVCVNLQETAGHLQKRNVKLHIQSSGRGRIDMDAFAHDRLKAVIHFLPNQINNDCNKIAL